MNLLSRTLEKSDYVFTIINDGERIANFRYVIVRIENANEKICYSINRDSRDNCHTIERSKKVNSWSSERRYKLYEDVQSFENAIKRIEKICDKSPDVSISVVG